MISNLYKSQVSTHWCPALLLLSSLEHTGRAGNMATTKNQWHLICHRSLCGWLAGRPQEARTSLLQRLDGCISSRERAEVSLHNSLSLYRGDSTSYHVSKQHMCVRVKHLHTMQHVLNRRMSSFGSSQHNVLGPLAGIML